MPDLQRKVEKRLEARWQKCAGYPVTIRYPALFQIYSIRSDRKWYPAVYWIVTGKTIFGLHFSFFVISTLNYKPLNIAKFCVTKCQYQMLDIAGILRMSSVTIFQSGHFVLSTNLLLNLTFRSP